jgi:hypothetical protein
MDFPVPVADRVELVLPVVEELVARRLLALPAEVRKLVVAVQVDTKVLVAGLVALQ